MARRPRTTSPRARADHLLCTLVEPVAIEVELTGKEQLHVHHRIDGPELRLNIVRLSDRIQVGDDVEHQFGGEPGVEP